MKKIFGMKHINYATYWTIWSIGFHRIKSYNDKMIDLKLFIGPLVITMWR